MAAKEKAGLRLNIHWQIILLLSAGIFSLAIIGSLTAGYFINKKISDIVYDEAERITSSFAHSSILPLLSGVGDSAIGDIQLVLTYKNVHALGIYKTNGDLLIGSDSLVEHKFSLESNKSLVPFKAKLAHEEASFWTFMAPVFDSDVIESEIKNVDSLFATSPNLLGHVVVVIDRTNLFKTQQELFVNNLYVSIAISLVLILISALFSRRLVKPLYQFVSLMEKAEDGDDSVKAEIVGPIEIEHMARGFNTMMYSLKQRRKYAERQHESLMQEIEDRVNVEGALRESESHLMTVLAHNEAVVSTIPGIIIEFDAQGKPLWWNKRAEQVTGLSEDSFGTKRFSELVGEVYRDSAQKAINDGLEHGSCELHTTIVTTNGEIPYQFNGVRISLQRNQNRRAKGKQTLLTVGMDDSESINTQIAMKEARDAALESSRIKSEFLANMSHEIRTPMNGMLGMLQLLSESNLNSEQKNLSDIALRSGDQLLSVINDVLDFSKMEAGKLEIDKHDFSLRELIEDVVDLFASKAYEKDIKIYADMGFDVPEVIRSDPQRLKQVLSNLVGNAVKFTESGHVLLKAAVDSSSQSLVLSVVDTGIGIETLDQGQIFESFAQVDGSSTRKFSGTGLGLTIVKQLSQLLGGTVEIESQPEAGSTFKVKISLSELEAEIECVAEAAQINPSLNICYLGKDRIQSSIFKSFSDHLNLPYRLISEAEYQTFSPVEKVYIFLIDQESFEACKSSELWRVIENNKSYILVYQHDLHLFEKMNQPLPKCLSKLILPLHYKTFVNITQGIIEFDIHENRSAQVSSETIQQKPIIMIVEDNEVNQRVILTMLEKLGHNALLAENGKQALDLLSANAQIELVIMDCQMPVMDGYTASRAIRNNIEQYNPAIKIIAMTGNAMEGDKQKCIDAGMDDYISKPIRLSSLKTLLKNYISNS